MYPDVYHRRKMTKKKNPLKPRNAAKPKTTNTKKELKNQPRRPKRMPAVPRKPQRKSLNLKTLKRDLRMRKRNLRGRVAAVLLRLPVLTGRSRMTLLRKIRTSRWLMLRYLLRRSRSGEDGRRGQPNLPLLYGIVVCPLLACCMGKGECGSIYWFEVMLSCSSVYLGVFVGVCPVLYSNDLRSIHGPY